MTDNINIQRDENSIVIDHADRVGNILKNYSISIESIDDSNFVEIAEMVADILGIALPSAMSELRAYTIVHTDPDVLSRHETIEVEGDLPSVENYVVSLSALNNDIEFPNTDFTICAACKESVEKTIHTLCWQCELPVHAKCEYNYNGKHFCSAKCAELYERNFNEG